MDLNRGYWQVPTAEEAKAKTAFITPFGLFQFNVMPFGLQGAPVTFQRLMDRVIQGLQDYAAAYLDDLIIFSTCWTDHLKHLATVLQRLGEAGLTVKPTICQLGMKECVYLGHIPQTKKQVRAFLGLAGYYRRFIPNFSAMAFPLTDLTKKTANTSKLKWTAECTKAFQQLKDALCANPVLKSLCFDRTFILQTDASNRGIGAVLSQCNEAGDEHLVAYFSRKLLPREQRYSTVEKECLTIKLSIEAFKVYLLGKPFQIQTDHRALVWLHQLKEKNARLTRWSLSLQPYDFSVVHRRGKDNHNADELSRYYGCDKNDS